MAEDPSFVPNKRFKADMFNVVLGIIGQCCFNHSAYVYSTMVEAATTDHRWHTADDSADIETGPGGIKLEN